jgi:asparagine synthase (glutamine-hydrolysing)
MEAMCGIVGFFGPPASSRLWAMEQALEHRGPDSGGHLETPAVSLGMRRLRIIDLETGDQPMSTADGRLHLVYNGEVYNYRELRVELEALGHVFRTRSDTEVVLEAFAEWDVAAFARFNGMWAIALLDDRGAEPRLVLCRDQFGIKPLYLTQAGDRLLFASEIKALLTDPDVVPSVNEDVLYQYLAFGLFDHSEDTFFQGIENVPAACYVDIRPSGRTTSNYWQPVLAEDGVTDPVAFRELFARAVERRLVSDAPVGACLSGGLDSSSIAVVLAAQLRAAHPDAGSLGRRVKTFSAVFPHDPIDESAYIDEVVAATHAESHRVVPDHGDLLAEVSDFAWQVEMPTVSSAPYAMWCVMRLAREHVTVLLDGQGGDELLGGYDAYPYVYLRDLLRRRRFGRFIVEGVRWADVVVPLVVKRLLSRFHRSPDAGLLRPSFARGRPRPVDDRSHDNLKVRLLQDLLTYSLPPLLRYEDRISMGQSIETRLPFLDQELVEAVLRLPIDAIMGGGWNRRILREALRDDLPPIIRRRRKKIGFTTPEFRWYRDELAGLEEILGSTTFAERPYWDAAAVRRAFREAVLGRGNHSLVYWRMINAEIWLRVYIDSAAASDSVASRIAA